jgi:glycosyltransferase involved in cell wall biosynthesis
MLRYVKRENIGIIYVQVASLLPVAAIVGKVKNIPVVFHAHVVHVDAKVRWVVNIFLQASSVKKIIAVSHYTLTQFSSKNRNKSTVLYNCVDIPDTLVVNAEKRIAQQPPVLAAIAEILPAKGQHVLFNAASKLQVPPRIEIIGKIIDVNYVKEIESQSYSFDYHFWGMRSDVSQLVDSLLVAVVVVASTERFETFSLSMVEAWAKGIPTIASNLGGMKELVETFLPEYKDIMLFEPGNADQLKQKIERLMQPKTYIDISKAVENVARINFSKATFNNNLLKIINSF